MNPKKTVIIVCILFAVIILYGYYFKLEKNVENSIFLKNPIDNKIQQSNKKFIPYEERIWNTYTDDRYKYFLEFPSGLNVFSVYERKVEVAESIGGGSFIRSGGVSFSDPELGDYGIMSVSVFENTNFSNVDEWLKEENKRFKNQKTVVEKRITIEDHDAIITYVQSDYEREDAYKHEKTTVFIKDGNLFEIWTRFTDTSNHEKARGSFKFNAS